MLETTSLDCPYCGERIELVVDTSADLEYIEDCEVCCRPIIVSVTLANHQIAVSARTENE